METNTLIDYMIFDTTQVTGTVKCLSSFTSSENFVIFFSRQYIGYLLLLLICTFLTYLEVKIKGNR